MFRKCNVDVHFCLIDKYDTIAYYADHYNCVVLSNDSNFM